MKKFIIITACILLPAISIAQNPGNGSELIINGRKMVYYPDLKLSAPPKDSMDENQVRSKSVTGASEIYGYVNGWAVVKNGSENKVSSLGASTVKDAIRATSTPTIGFSGGFVLFNKTENKYEYTDGVFQVEMRFQYQDIDLGADYDVSVTGNYGRYKIIKLNTSDNFQEIYQQLSNDARIAYVVTYFMPPKSEPR